VDALRRPRRALEKHSSDRSTRSAAPTRSSPRCRAAPPLASTRSRKASAPTRLLLEYYKARGQLYVCVLRQNDLDIVPLGPIAQVRGSSGAAVPAVEIPARPEFVGAVGEQLHGATLMHLRQLYDVLIAPVRDRLHARHLVIVPHDLLHFLPFHALFDGERYLIDDFSVSFAPSASVYRCAGQSSRAPAAAR